MNVIRAGDGALVRTAEGLRLWNPPALPGVYTNAQLDDYHTLPRRAFPLRPPLMLSLEARFSHAGARLAGTAGFGLWNDPFAMSGARPPAPPRALWFFHSAPPLDMPLAAGVPGWGWKAAALDTLRLPFWLLAPAAPFAMPLLRIPALHRLLCPAAQAAAGIAEAALEVEQREWHSYRLDWEPGAARFSVDGRTALEAPAPHGGRLGLVIWIDNQYMVADPRGRFAHGVTPRREAQWMEIRGLRVEAPGGRPPGA